MLTMQWVRQEDSNGCAVACLAMVTGDSYAAVKAAWPEHRRIGETGLCHTDVMQYLGDRRIAHLLRYRHALGWNTVTATEDLRRVRADWPQPFAPVHIVSVNHGRHDVVLLADGTVLDPMCATPRRLADFGEVGFMLGVWPDLKLPILETKS